MNKIRYIFSENGPIKQLKPDYIERPSQINASEKLFDALNNNSHFIMEGPCGFGKTFAYLIPIYQNIIDSDFNKIAVIVTNGISLQEQLYYKDTPLINKIMKLNNPDADFNVALLKGKQNFVCANKMKDLVADSFTSSATVSNFDEFEKIRDWYFETKTGDFSELNFVPSFETLQNVACVTEGECLGKSCPNYDSCFYQKHKSQVNKANIIITNYHMLFSDLKIGGRILPKYDILVFDEAHEVVNICRDYFSVKVTINTMKKIRNDFSEVFNKEKLLKEMYHDRLNIQLFLSEAEKFFDKIDRELFKIKYDNIIIFDETSTLPDSEIFSEELGRILEITMSMQERIFENVMALKNSGVDENDPDYINKQKVSMKINGLFDKINEIKNIIDNYKEIASQENEIFWCEKEKEIVSINYKPLMIGDIIYENFLSRENMSCIFTSATLSVNESFKYIKEQTGLDLVDKSRLSEFIGESPFNLTEQQLWYLPQDCIDGNAKDFDNMLPKFIEQIIKACGGGVLCLFTSIKNMNDVYYNLRWEFKEYKLLKQGDRPRAQLIEEFSRDENSVLFGTKSFFTGIDIPGNSLRCVVIDKLPFPTPNNPVQQKLRNRPNAFYKYSIPEMIITLKQAVGRGVRSMTDKCVISILDGRMATAKYKSRINNSFNYQKTGTRNLDDLSNFLGINNRRNVSNPYIEDDKEIPF